MDRFIQVVEDDANIRFIVEYILKDASYFVETFENARAFNNRSQNKFVDLVIMDVMLPDGNGIELSKTLKTNLSTRNIPVIIMSAHCSSSIALHEGRADGFIQKPFDLDTFIYRVKEVVGTRPG